MSGTRTMMLSASLEDYLEAILQTTLENRVARAKDLSKRLNVGRSSVTGALHALAERELINYSPYDVITLTDKGLGIARDVLRRHETLREFFVRVLEVDEKNADETACRMEHAIPEVVLQRFVDFIDFVKRCPRSTTTWIEGIGYHCSDRLAESCDNCEKCTHSVFGGARNEL